MATTDGKDIEQDFLAAIGRIKRGCPNNTSLKELAARGRLKMTLSNVAKEAGRSRTLIALEDCRYPEIRALVQTGRKLGSPRGAQRDEIIRRLRQEKKELVAKLAAADTENANLLLRMSILEKSSARANRRANRANHGDPNLVIGRAPPGKNVIPFHGE